MFQPFTRRRVTCSDRLQVMITQLASHPLSFSLFYSTPSFVGVRSSFADRQKDPSASQFSLRCLLPDPTLLWVFMGFFHPRNLYFYIPLEFRNLVCYRFRSNSLEVSIESLCFFLHCSLDISISYNWRSQVEYTPNFIRHR